MKETTLVESYVIERADSGIYTLIFNTAKRMEKFHQANDYMYVFGEDYESVVVEEFLPKDVMFINAVAQNKDQICFYFIPFGLLENANIIKEVP
jgi:hypothetical protein